MTPNRSHTEQYDTQGVHYSAGNRAHRRKLYKHATRKQGNFTKPKRQATTHRKVTLPLALRVKNKSKYLYNRLKDEGMTCIAELIRT